MLNTADFPVSLRLPFSEEEITAAIKMNGGETPFHLYSEKYIQDAARRLNNAFATVGIPFKNYYAVKACPNPYILEVLAKEGMGMDCSSIPELILSEAVGKTGEEIMFTANNITIEDFQAAKDRGAIINLDDIEHIAKLKKIGIPDLVCCRFNPGDLKEGNSIIGKPTEAKYGMRRDQIIKAYTILKNEGVQRFGLHTMVVSNERDETALVETAKILFELVAEISEKVGIRFEFINLGGGIGVPYRPTDREVDVEKFAAGVAEVYQEILVKKNFGSPKIFMESGRWLTGPAAALITRVVNVTEKYRKYIGVDASMQNLMRPALYGAYHHITALGKENLPHDDIVCVTGSLCENNDQFALQRELPKLEEGDILAMHTSGAHGYAMGFNYNGKLRCAELLIRENGAIEKIRKAETIKELFATLDYRGL